MNTAGYVPRVVASLLYSRLGDKMKAQIQQTLGAREWRWTLKEEAVNQGLNVGLPIPLSKKSKESFSGVLQLHNH